MNLNYPKNSKRQWMMNVFTVFSAVWMLTSCGKVKDEAVEIANEHKVEGHWLMTESENAGAIAKALEKESVVLTFKNNTVAFSPVGSVKGRALFATVAKCTKGPRPYSVETSTIVLPAHGACPEKRVAIQQLDGATLKFPDPETPAIIRVFTRIDETKYNALVKAADRRP